MIVAFSTSSPLAGVALFDLDGRLIAIRESHAPRAASGTCLTALQALLDETRRSLHSVELFVADLGPGSFTGVKVGVTLAKTLAFAQGARIAGVRSFDLIATRGTTVVASKRGEWLVRHTGREPERSTERPSGAMGYGEGIEPTTYPSVRALEGVAHTLDRLEPERLLPYYLTEPSISVPKRPH